MRDEGFVVVFGRNYLSGAAIIGRVSTRTTAAATACRTGDDVVWTICITFLLTLKHKRMQYVNTLISTTTTTPNKFVEEKKSNTKQQNGTETEQNRTKQNSTEEKKGEENTTKINCKLERNMAYKHKPQCSIQLVFFILMQSQKKGKNITKQINFICYCNSFS